MADLKSLDLRDLQHAPAVRQLFIVLGLAAAVALGLLGYRYTQTPAQVPLVSGLSDTEALEITEALKAAGIVHTLDLSRGAVRVAADRADAARLSLAAQGLPRANGSGFEMMNEAKGLGASQFLENARYQHALETELARTVQALQPVRSARVHLAIPRPSAFTRTAGQPSASVLLDLHPGRSLERRQVAAIVHLVAASVPGMTAAQVAVIDQSGRLLSQQGGEDPLAVNAEQLDFRRQLEAEYARRIQEILLPVLGAGRFNAQVSLDLDWTITEEARETFSPEGRVRSERTQEESRRDGSGPAGVPGALSNQPPETALAAAPAAPRDEDASRVSRRAERAFELDRVLSHSRQGGARVQRLTVAVVVDHVRRPVTDEAGTRLELQPLTAAELAQVEALVREATGFTEARGDRISVQNLPFVTPELPELPSPPIWKQPETLDLARHGAGVLMALLLLLLVVRPLLKALTAPPPRAAALTAPSLPGALPAGLPSGLPAALPASAPEVVPAGEGPATERLPQAIGKLDFEDKLQAARSAVAEDPKRVAQVVKNWINREG